MMKFIVVYWEHLCIIIQVHNNRSETAGNMQAVVQLRTVPALAKIQMLLAISIWNVLVYNHIVHSFPGLFVPDYLQHRKYIQL